eukprot:6490640-Amphidinium_carterae.1
MRRGQFLQSIVLPWFPKRLVGGCDIREEFRLTAMKYYEKNGNEWHDMTVNENKDCMTHRYFAEHILLQQCCLPNIVFASLPLILPGEGKEL